MRKIIRKELALITLACVLVCAGCGAATDNTEPVSEETVDYGEGLGGKLANEFVKLAKEGKDAQTIADALGKESFCGYDCAVGEIQEGYLPGFSSDVTGFKSGVSFLPWIGSIPFAGYVFVLEDGADAEAFANDLKSIADPMWNICTEAKDPVVATNGNLVFLTMVPAEE